MKKTQSEKEELSKRIQILYGKQSHFEGIWKALPALEYETLYEAQKKRAQIEKEVHAMEEDIQQKQDVWDASHQKLTALRSKLETLNDRYKQTQKESAAAGKDLEETIQKYGFASQDEYIDYFVDEDVLETNKNTIEVYQKEVHEVDSKLRYATEQIRQTKYQNVEVLSTALQEKEKKLKEARNKCDADKEMFHNNQKWTDNFISQATQIETIRKQRDRTHRLYSLLRGTISGKDRISLENYVQLTGFKGILEAANRRLDPMSEGQYQLYLHEEDDAVHQNIFELDILDHWTGKKRSVRTLSGGESFKASLSLALGLSDFVASSSGGIQFNTLFIDEGFGTLDQQSLNDAMQVLTQLSEKGKLVGIISHREELKEQISRQIVVTKDRKGSHIQTKPDD